MDTIRDNNFTYMWTRPPLNVQQDKFSISGYVADVINHLVHILSKLVRGHFPGCDCEGQGWARDVKARDRDETETLTSRDGDETETLASPDETRPRRDVCSSRGVIETLKYKF